MKEMNYSKRTKSISRLLNVGKEDVFIVIGVDSKNKKSYIDLSQKNINKNESDECKNRYGKSKQVENIAKQHIEAADALNRFFAGAVPITQKELERYFSFDNGIAEVRQSSVNLESYCRLGGRIATVKRDKK